MKYCKAAPADRAGFCALMQQTFGDSEAFTGMVFDRFAGPGRVYLARAESGEIAAILCAVPVTMRTPKGENHTGAYFYALATVPQLRGQGVMSGLIEHVCAELGRQGASFVVLAPASAALFDFYEKRGFQKAFGRRVVERKIRHNLWAQAEFDTVTAKHWQTLRASYMPCAVTLTGAGAVAVLTDLYSLGATIVSAEDGYGIYFVKGETLRFTELLAEGDRAAERLMEAARERERAERAVIALGAAQGLFLGEGTLQDYGMIRFLNGEFDVSESYMANMMDEEG